MECDDNDHQLPAASEKVTSIGDGDELQGSSAHQVITPSRCYECNFCKRGFSNAQALGGHMNIHRKDKAKLKQQQQQQPLEDNIIHHHKVVPPILEAAKPDNNHPNWPYWNVSPLSREQSLALHIRKQLPLFAESPQMEHKPEGQRGHFSSSHHGSSSSELDLELRLGPEPHDNSSTGARKFL